MKKPACFPLGPGAATGTIEAMTDASTRNGSASILVVVAGDAGSAREMRALLDGRPDIDVVVLVIDGVFAESALARADRDKMAAGVRSAVRAAATAAPARARHEVRLRPLVLVVEDDEFSHQLVSSMLMNENVELAFEPDGAAAIDRIRSLDPDLVLMDVNLPGSDGVALTQQLKSEPALAAIPVVMLTGEARRDILIRSMEAGACDFIVKPFSRDALVAKLERYLPAAG